jgi:phenylpropionate dioxygenase-like ring-hydroxylating dioxygenase large terminal subunit
MDGEVDLSKRDGVRPTSSIDVRAQKAALRALRTELTRKIVDYARAGRTALADGVLREDVSFFLDEQLFEREFKKLFHETPIVACLSKEVPEPGSFRLFEDLGVPIVVVRGKDGAVRAFLNICPHRGAKVVREDCGKANRFTCRFHGWTFDSTGAAIGVPGEDKFCGEIDEDKHLIACPAEERHGLVFVQATPNSTMDLDAHLGAFGPELEKYGLAQCEPVMRGEVSIRSNWKYTLDTYFENYHLPSLHKDTFANVFAKDLCYFEPFGPHQRFTYPHATIPDWMNKPESEWPVDALPLQNLLFPNTVIVLGSVSKTGQMISINRMFPKSVGELTTKITLYAPGGVQSPEHQAEIEANFASIMGAVRDEDYSVTGEAYLGLSALPAGLKFPMGRQEAGTQHLHNCIRAAVS